MKNYPGMMESFERLIAVPSVSSVDPKFDQSNQGMIDLLANWLGDMGAELEIVPVPNKNGKSNLIACFGHGDGGLVLSGHTDTVPFDEPLWQQDPFQLTEKDGKLFGLGATDMKVFFPLLMSVLSEINHKDLKRPVIVLATADEESTMSGAQALANSGRKLGRHALIGEPTGLKPVNAHKGVMMESITVIGKTGHSSNPQLGRNALEGMMKVLSGLTELRNNLQQQYHNPGFAVPYPTMNFGSIQGGDNPNRICAECELKLDVRMMPGMEIEETRRLIRAAAQDAIANSGIELRFTDLFDGLTAMYTDADSSIVKVAETLSEAEASSVAFATEGPFLNAMGMETIIMGPGDIDVAHQANEYVPIERLEPMKQMIHGLINKLCMV